jgi:hypothetical protein
VAAVIDGRRLAIGHGSSRQRAEEDAAAASLELLDAEQSSVSAEAIGARRGDAVMRSTRGAR